MSPSIYILRSNTDKMPTTESCEPGDCVIIPNGDVLVRTQTMWDLLPGSLISIDELKEFVGYIANGWPDDPGVALADMRGKVPDEFLSRMAGTVSRI